MTHPGTTVYPSGGYLARPQPSGLADVLNIILDKGIVIDAFVRVSLVGIELLTIDARIVIASVDTYLRFAEAVNRLNLGADSHKPGLPDLIEGVGHVAKKSKVRQSAKKLAAPVKKLAEPVHAAKEAVTAAPAKAKHGLFGRAAK